jgi:peptidoglycan hydrolase CwlO-like protein
MTTEERLEKVEGTLHALKTAQDATKSTLKNLADLIQQLVKDQKDHNGATQNLIDQLHSERGSAARSALAAEAAWEKLRTFINNQPDAQAVTVTGTSGNAE